MQQFKSLFKDGSHKGTISNIQSCLRLNDIEEIGDGSHLLYFDMIGLFSFRELTVQGAICFWMEFLHRINCTPDYITIHPDKPEWEDFYSGYNVEIRYDEGCIWSDGEIGGYCTEFYKDGIEIGNVVNPLGTCIDVGFGLDRIVMVLTKEMRTKEDTLRQTVLKIIDSGFTPTQNKQGSLLRKLLRICYLGNIVIEHQFYLDEISRQQKISQKYNRLKERHKDKSKEFWWSTYGIDLDLV